MNRHNIFMRSAATLAASVILSACADFSLIKATPPPAPVTLPPEQPKPVEVPPPSPWGVTKLLMQADMAFKRGRYTTPDEDNAFDRYKAVLVLDPGNAQALAGLDSVHMAYVDYVRSVKSSGNIPEALELVARGETYFPNSPLLKQLKHEMKRHYGGSSPARKPSGSFALDGTRVLLPEQPLRKQSEEVKTILVALAKRVRQSDESILIIARNDREGRWIYQTMQQAAPGYRIRGDIHISRTPAVEFMPPL